MTHYTITPHDLRHGGGANAPASQKLEGAILLFVSVEQPRVQMLSYADHNQKMTNELSKSPLSNGNGSGSAEMKLILNYRGIVSFSGTSINQHQRR